jgi:hypothetical protein
MMMLKAFLFLVMATTFEASGDAVVRIGLFQYAGLTRVGLLAVGAMMLFVYGVSLNLAPVEFGRVVGLYIATLFVVWQIVNLATFRTAPTVPTLVGGSLIVVGGLIVTFWKAN